MPVYEEKQKVDGKTRYYIRTYIKKRNGKVKQITKHNSDWIGREGKILAQQEENRMKMMNPTDFEIEKNSNISLSELKKQYLISFEGRVEEDTIYSKEVKLNHFCEIDLTGQVETDPEIPIKEIDIDYFEKWQRQMKKKLYPKVAIFNPSYSSEWKNEEKDRKYTWVNYSIKQLNKIQKEIVKMFGFAVDKGILKNNPIKDCDSIGTAKEIKYSKKNTEYNVINYDEKEKLMEATKYDIKFNTLFDLWFSRGPRPGEVRAFKIKDYDYENAQIMVNRNLSRHNASKLPKSPASNAPIDLGDRLNEKLNKYVNALKKMPNYSDEWYLFGNQFVPISSHGLNSKKEYYFEKAHIDKHIRLHDFRHSCATWLYSLGIPVIAISKILRHKNVDETLKTYTHLFNEDYEKIISDLG